MFKVIKQILFQYQLVKEKWQHMKENEEFYYDVLGGSLFGRKKKENRSRKETDALFWKKIDDYIDDPTTHRFPNSIKTDDGTTYQFVGKPQATTLSYHIHDDKEILSKNIKAFNRNEKSTKKITKDNIENLVQQYNRVQPTTAQVSLKAVESPIEENTVVILILCHGMYGVNSSLTIDTIPAPTNKFIEIVKRAPFGYKSLLDFDYSSRYTDDKTSTRYSVAHIKEKLAEAYTLVLKNVTSISNVEQYTKRKCYIYEKKHNPEWHYTNLGTPQESCIHVGFEYSHLPFLNKKYELDRPPPNGYQRGEFAHGIVIMFKDAEGKLIQQNLNRLEDFLWLQEAGYINVSDDLITHYGTSTRDLDSKEGVEPSEILITKLDTEVLLKVIESFPENYKMFKIVDNSCAVLDASLTEEQKMEVYERYGADMRCTNPEYVRGGLKKRKRQKKTQSTKRYKKKIRCRKTKCRKNIHI